VTCHVEPAPVVNRITRVYVGSSNRAKIIETKADSSLAGSCACVGSVKYAMMFVPGFVCGHAAKTKHVKKINSRTLMRFMITSNKLS